MKTRSLISSSLLAAALGLGINAPAQAHDSVFSLWRLDRDYYPHVHHDRYYGGDHHHRHYKKHWKRHHWRGHDGDRHGWRRDHDRHGGHDRDRRH
jgi:hypothetical protein